MSSSGLIYAGIVGAWAVYLVPVWLRREEQLNEARKKARYAAAIRALGRTEQFERRWRTEEALSATGTDGPWRPPAESADQPGIAQQPGKPSATPAKKAVPPPNRRPQTAGAKPATGAASSTQDRRPQQPAGRRPATVSAAEQQRPHSVTARLPHAPHGKRPAATPQQRQQAHSVRRRGVLLMRRRRAVAFLFTLATAGAFVSAVLGLGYIWAMLAPAALFSVYIVNIRRDERLRAEERYRRRQAVLAAERRRDRQRAQAEATAPTAPSPTIAATRHQGHPEPFRRAANG